MASRDLQRSAVYSAEDQLCALLDRGGPLDFFGSALILPVQRRFADLPSVQRYVDDVLALAPVRAIWPEAGPIRVRERAGAAKAHYETDGAVLAVPLAGPPPRWAGRELVVLHEVAHHLSPPRADRAAHGAHFADTMLRLVGAVLGDAAALVLRAAYDGAGVRIGLARA